MKLSRLWVVSVGLGCLIGIGGCMDTHTNVLSAADEVERSTNPSLFLAGLYRLDRLDLPSGYGEQSPALTSRYELTVRTVGDSVRLILSGTGKAGVYTDLPLGTFAVTTSTGNLASVSVGNLYRFDLRRLVVHKSYISFARTPYTDKTEYNVLFNLYRAGSPDGAIIADENYSGNPSFNERIATLRLVRTSPGVWRAK